jgi:small subunit ribosomal protein S19
MVRKETYKGVEEDNLRTMSLDEFAKITTARNRRTLRRLNVNIRLKKFIEKVKTIKKTNPKKVIRTHLRDAIILPEWVGLKFAVHNGKEFKQVEITYDKIGKRLGDFSHSTARVIHSGPGVGATRGSKFVPLK